MPISGGSYTLPTNNFAQPVPGNRVQAVDGAETLTDIETALDSMAGGTGVSFTQAGTGAVARTVQAKLREIVTPQDFTASTIDDYTTDASSAIQAAIDYAATTGKQVYIPAGTYKVGTALEVKGNGTSLIGDGPLATILKSPNASNPIITFANGISQVSVRGLELNRAVTATAGGNGLETPTGAYIDCLLEDIWSRNNYIGFRLGATAFARGSRLRSEQNVSHGFYLTNSLAANGGQWYLHGLYSGNNGGDGFRAESDAAATTGFPIGELINYQSYGNDGYGFAAIGTPGCPIQSVRLSQVFLGQDGKSEIYLDCYGVNHVIDGVFIELPGTGLTGPTNSTAASGIGHGIEITANSNDVQIASGKINGCSQSGIKSAATYLKVSNVKSINNGQEGTSGAEYQSGFYVSAGIADFVGCEARNTGGTTQKYGIYLTNDAEHTATGCRLRGNATAPIGAGTTLNTLKLSGNVPAEVRTTDLSETGLVLSLATGNPYPAGTLTNQVTLYLTPAKNRLLPLWNGSNWSMQDIGSELSHSINDATYSPAAASTDSNYDVFAFYDRSADTIRLCRGPAWSSGTSRGTGSGTTELERHFGIYVNKQAITNGPAARCGVYLGTIRANVSAFMDYNFEAVDVNGTAASNRCGIGLWNMYNRKNIVASLYTSNSSWTYNSQTVRIRDAGAAHAGANDRFTIVSGLAEDDIHTTVDLLATSADAAPVAHLIGIGLDSTTAFYGAYGGNLSSAAGAFMRSQICDRVPAQIGNHYISVLEAVQQAAKTCTVYGGRNRSTTTMSWRC